MYPIVSTFELHSIAPYFKPHALLPSNKARSFKLKNTITINTMSKPMFACTTCGEDFTRRTSAERHNRNVHNGYCLIVRYVEYLAGLASRLYPPPITPPRLSRRNKLIGFSIDRNKIQGNFVPNNSIWRENALDNMKHEVEKSDHFTQFLNRLHKQSEWICYKNYPAKGTKQ